MRTFKLTFLIVLFILSIEFVKANNEQPRGIDLGEYAFGIPAKQLNFDTYSKFTLSFWINVKELNLQIHIVPRDYEYSQTMFHNLYD